MEKRAIIKFFSPQGKAPKEIHAIVTKTLACFVPGRAKDFSATCICEVRYVNCYIVNDKITGKCNEPKHTLGCGSNSYKHKYYIYIYIFVCFWRDSPQWAMASTFTSFLDHTQRRTTFGRIPLDKWSARRRDLYLTSHNTHSRQTSMAPVGFEPTIPAGEKPQTYTLDRAATGTGIYKNIFIYVFIYIFKPLSTTRMSTKK